MLALQNRTPYAAERCFVRDKTGSDHWVVAVKATFSLDPQRGLTLADEQLPPLLAPEYFGEPGRSSIRYESDFSLMKPATDVLVNASAWAPHGHPIESLPVRLRAHRIDKTLMIWGQRRFHPGGRTTTHAQPFVQMPIRYEHAWGGTDVTSQDESQHRIDARNPIGCGFATRAAHLEHGLAPCVLYQSGNPATVGPAGYGALASYWSPRRELGGTYDAAWANEQRPLLPTDWNELSLLSAPADQRTDGYLRGSELVELVHMTPDSVLRFEVPKIFLAFETHFGSKVEEHRGRLVTLIVEPDDRRVLVVWQTTLRVPLRRIDHLDQTDIWEKRYI